MLAENKILSFSQKPNHGFATAVLTQEKEATSSWDGASLFSQMAKKQGYLLISKDTPDEPKRNKQQKRKRGLKTRNRKTVTNNDEITHNGVIYRVNARKSGLYIQMMKSIIDQFEAAARLWSRVFVLRFDLHQDFYTKDNKLVSKFIKRISTKLKREYDFKKIGFCWVREQERGKAQHYHCVLFLEGRKIQHSQRIMEFIKQAWESPLGGFHVPYFSRPFYFGKRDDIAEQVIYRISYLAKVRGKGYRPPQTKDFQCSRISIE